MNDLSTDEDILSAEIGPSSATLASEFTRPAFSFKGQELRPYTAGTDLLFNQVLDRNDANLTVFLSFIFIHLAKWVGAVDPNRPSGSDRQRATESVAPTSGRAALLDLCWDKTKFRGALLDWIETLGELTDADKLAAGDLFTEMRDGARKSSVEVIPDAAEKKTKAKRPRK